MSYRKHNLTQVWDCPFCKERTVFKAHPAMPPESFVYLIHGYSRRHTCNKCGGHPVITTWQVILGDLGGHLNKLESLRRSMEEQKKKLESLRAFKIAIEGELSKLQVPTLSAPTPDGRKTLPGPPTLGQAERDEGQLI